MRAAAIRENSAERKHKDTIAMNVAESTTAIALIGDMEAPLKTGLWIHCGGLL